MTAAEWILKMETGQVESASLYSYFDKGEFTDEDILEAYRVKDSPRFIAKVQAFSKGTLFAAQTENFDSFIEGKNREEDKKRAWEYLSVEESAQQKNVDIHKFIENRIYCPLPSNKERENLGAVEKARTFWIDGNTANGWNWR